MLLVWRYINCQYCILAIGLVDAPLPQSAKSGDVIFTCRGESDDESSCLPQDLRMVKLNCYS